MRTKPNKLTPIDPQIPISLALSYFDNSQAKLARELHLKRATVNGWIKKERREFMPPLYAYRLLRVIGQRVDHSLPAKCNGPAETNISTTASTEAAA